MFCQEKSLPVQVSMVLLVMTGNPCIDYIPFSFGSIIIKDSPFFEKKEKIFP
jgi:hypothetical protein